MINLKSMRKKIIVFLMLLALPVLVLGAFQPATLTNGVDRVAVFTQEQAQKYFGLNYFLEGGEKPADKCLDCVGALPGGDVFQPLTVHNSFIDGGKYVNASTTLTTNDTLTAKEVCEASVISVNSAAVAGTQSAAGLTVTLPATSTLFSTCLKEVGAHKSFLFVNLSPTAASTTVITAGSGMDLMEPDDGSAFDVAIAGLARAKIDIWRMPKGFESGLDAVVLVTDMSIAD